MSSVERDVDSLIVVVVSEVVVTVVVSGPPVHTTRLSIKCECLSHVGSFTKVVY